MRDYLPTENVLEDWLPIFFADLNILPALMQESFGILDPMPDFFALYQQCCKLKRMFSIEFIYPWQLWALSNEDYPQRALSSTGFDNFNFSPRHYVLFCGHDAFIEEYFQGAKDVRYLQMAALSGNMKLIRIFSQRCHDLQTADSSGRSCVHYAAASGSAQALAKIIDLGQDIPYFPYQLDHSGNTIMHYAALSGDPTLMEWMFDKHPDLIEYRANYDINFFHLALRSGSILLFDFLAKHKHRISSESFLEKFKKSTTSNGKNIAHFAARSGNATLIAKVLELFPALQTSYDSYGTTLLHVAALSGSSSMIEFLWEKVPKIRYRVHKDEANILHYAAQSGYIAAVEKCLELNSALFFTVDKEGKSILDYAERSKSRVLLRWLLIEKTLEVGLHLWPKAKTQVMDFPYFIKSLYLVFAEAIQFIYDNKATLQWIKFLFIHFKLELANYLASPQLTIDPHIVLELLEEDKWFSFEKNSQGYAILTCVLRMKTIPTIEKPLTKSLIWTLITTLKQNAEIDSELIWTLQHFLLNTGLNSEDSFQDEEITAFGVIIQDYLRKNAQDPYRKINNNLVHALLATSTLSCMRPQHNPINLEITPETYGKHLSYIERIGKDKKDLPSSVHACLDYSIFPGVRAILENRPQIIAHFLEKHSLFWLALNLPIHLENVPFGQVEKLEKMLDCLLENYIAAFYIAHKVGELYAFFSQLEEGLCIEGRIGKVSTWAATYSDCEKVDDILVKAVRCYRAYATWMKGMRGNEVEDIHAARTFITARYLGKKCQVHPQYAPEGQLTEQGISDYLTNILSFDTVPAPLVVLKKIDTHIGQLDHPGEKAAFIQLRLRINLALEERGELSDAELETLLETWKNADSLIPGKKNKDLIINVLNGYSLFAEKIKGISFLKNLLGLNQYSLSENVPNVPL